MAKTKYAKELEQKSQGELVRMCEGAALPHTGDKQALVARLVEAEQAESKQAEEPEPEPKVEPPAPEPGASEPED